MKPSKNIVIVAGKRTPFGSFGGSFKDLTATDLAVSAAKATLASIGCEPTQIDMVCFGNVCQTSADAIYFARHVGLRCGCRVEVPALTVQRLCGSGFEAIAQAMQAIELGEAHVVLCGGAEAMSQAPHVVRGARWGVALGPGGKLEDTLWSCLTDSQTGMAMANTAEKLARTHGITRQACDDFALQGQQRYAAALAAGIYDNEIAPVEVPTRKGPQLIGKDEHPRPETTPEALAKLKAVFEKDGVVTAGNASGIVDGGCALLVTTAERAQAEGWPIIARLVAVAAVGCDPTVMGIGPVPAVQKALAQAGWTVADMDAVEVNEAFAPQYLAVEKDLGLDREKTNIHGGAIALGHPLAASGARITLHLALHLQRTGGKRAVGSACIGGGQGIAVVLAAA
ncbi:MAG: acetyl-CoA C-acetyltransferase [Myxococcales bacterium]|nr:acetyl-CoA C-acetyltransferase [Myxococcales bacterium]